MRGNARERKGGHIISREIGKAGEGMNQKKKIMEIKVRKKPLFLTFHLLYEKKRRGGKEDNNTGRYMGKAGEGSNQKTS